MASAAGGGGSVPPPTTKVEAASAPEPKAPNIMPHEECISGIRSALKRMHRYPTAAVFLFL
jgi:hypothetical protein